MSAPPLLSLDMPVFSRVVAADALRPGFLDQLNQSALLRQSVWNYQQQGGQPIVVDSVNQGVGKFDPGNQTITIGIGRLRDVTDLARVLTHEIDHFLAQGERNSAWASLSGRPERGGEFIQAEARNEARADLAAGIALYQMGVGTTAGGSAPLGYTAVVLAAAARGEISAATAGLDQIGGGISQRRALTDAVVLPFVPSEIPGTGNSSINPAAGHRDLWVRSGKCVQILGIVWISVILGGCILFRNLSETIVDPVRGTPLMWCLGAGSGYRFSGPYFGQCIQRVMDGSEIQSMRDFLRAQGMRCTDDTAHPSCEVIRITRQRGMNDSEYVNLYNERFTIRWVGMGGCELQVEGTMTKIPDGTLIWYSPMVEGGIINCRSFF